MIKIKLEGITLISEDVLKLAYFYENVLGFKCIVQERHYAEFLNEGVRLAICLKGLMADNTNQHYTYVEPRAGQSVELNFECPTPEEVHSLYTTFISKGATPIAEPTVKDWGHTTAFFADPEGNIHSLFAINPV